MFLRALRWQHLSNCLGAAFRTFLWKSCCFPAGFRSIWTKLPTGPEPLWCRCSFFARLKATAKNPNKVGILELFVTHPDEEKHYFPERTLLNKIFLGLDYLGRTTRPLNPKKIT